MTDPNPTSCRIRLSQWETAKTKNNTLKNAMVPPVFREKCPCILLKNSAGETGTYFDKRVTKSECQNNNITTKNNMTNNNTKYNYNNYIGEYTITNNNPDGKVIYYIYVHYSDDLLNFINNYKYANYFTVSIYEYNNKKYIAVSSYYKYLIKALTNALHKQVSNEYNTEGNKANNMPLYQIRDTQSAGSRKKVKTHRKNKIVTINKKDRKTKKQKLL